jgi:hypothetical protein
MSYSSRGGKRPNEYASKSSHSHIINDEDVKSFIEECNLPPDSDDIFLDEDYLFDLELVENNPINNIVAIDGGYTEISVKKSYPSATLSFFQFGALFFKLTDLEELAVKPFISPDDMTKLKNLERIKLVLPTKNISVKNLNTLTLSVRTTIFDFFRKKDADKNTYIETLEWFIFQLYEDKLDCYNLSECPSCKKKSIELKRSEMKDFSFQCGSCNQIIFLTDVFRLHEAIDDELGAGGILGYVTVLIEQILLIHTLRIILKIQPGLLNNMFFIKDGPLAFFGQTANMHKPMRNLNNYLLKKHNLFLAGLEKSGAFVEHAKNISPLLHPNKYLILNNDYIYTFILPGDPKTAGPYAETSYYGSKIIFKSKDERIYVITLPTESSKVVMKPLKENFKNIDIILHNIEKLKCDMYDDALFPIALANKLVSLSNHPSSILLEKFAKQKITSK